MKSLLILICVLFSSLFLIANEKRIDEVWTDDFQQALKMSEETNKPIFINFTGSDWCGWCIRLHDEVFEKDEFLKFAQENLILFKADFPKNIKQSDDLKLQNGNLQKKYGIKGFPTIVIIDNKEKVLATTGYRQGGAKLYVEHIIDLLK